MVAYIHVCGELQTRNGGYVNEVLDFMTVVTLVLQSHASQVIYLFIYFDHIYDRLNPVVFSNRIYDRKISATVLNDIFFIISRI